MKFKIQLLSTFLCTSLVYAYIEEPGPRYPPTKGELWPKPYHQIKNHSFFTVRKEHFNFKIINNTCSIVEEAIKNYESIIFSGYTLMQENLNLSNHHLEKKPWLSNPKYLGILDVLEISLDIHCNGKEMPSDHMEEAYTIIVSEDVKRLKAFSVWGILRGLESFSQMIYMTNEGLSLRINKTSVEDRPRFSHRGLLIDTSRHFIPIKNILLTLDAMAYNKLNVFHWHIVDDQSFPYVSRKFPELSLKGAYTSYYTYSYKDIQNITEYARVRGIRVIPEFDTPGHTRSWGVAHPEILTACEGDLKGKYGPIDPTQNKTYTFLDDFFEEISNTFADAYIHLGGDEVEFECWSSSTIIKNFMKKNGINDFKALENFYLQKLINMVAKRNRKYIVWEEVFTNGVKLPNNAIVQVWKTYWHSVLLEVTNSNRTGILSSCWYLDHLNTGGDWIQFYNCEPLSFSSNPKNQLLVVGGEACMWAEVVNQNNIMSRVWPRASATAEKLWSQRDDNYDLLKVRKRLEEHTCRMNRRGIEAQPPNGPGFCY
ncbi:beta-hexosaminidase subunit beta [Diabrotica virgifera virgifera]|uniref:Beta-hexosaminidase n=1 Tax=Diabrotica virgifera virgifera TaxID=50390 RepID=A0A6P7FFV2_DIAVI|nr:beta-hexosaminidase subunit beta [Diabrotica virgifera virgifera]XP_028134932.1 beta-hexosaminidase subunit beta [Diabrotica virgifera virgifera]XP_028134939.1 beta-hexosaminidase subunit beta [Diabrotica virgifera virgifera]